MSVTGLVIVAPPPVSASAAQSPRTIRVNLSSTGAQANGDNNTVDVPAVSADGRYVAFVTFATNLVPGDTNNAGDVFLRDVATGRTRRVSVSSTGAQANHYSGEGVAVSADGRYVAFTSVASNLVPGDTDNLWDVFVRDMLTGTTRRVDVSSTGAQANNQTDYRVAISADGQHVAFTSYASNLVPGDTNNAPDVFLHDMASGRTRRVTVRSTGTQADQIGNCGVALSADGRYVAFLSYATNLVPGDTNDAMDVFVRDMDTERTRRVSVSSTGAQADKASNFGVAVSADGRHVAFGSNATNLVPGDTNDAIDVFVRDVDTGRTRRVSVSSTGAETPGGGFGPSISADGQHITFSSDATNLVPGDTNGWDDVFLHDMDSGRTRRVSVSNTGAQGDITSDGQAISADGRHVVFWSMSTNLVPGDTNNYTDLFLHRLAS
jgi:hypothetical protein